MFGLTSKMYEYLAVSVIIAAFAGFFYFWGWSHEHSKLVGFEAQVAQQVEDQKRMVAEMDANHTKEMQDAKKSYDADVARIDKYYRMHNGGSGSLPEAVANPSGVNGSPAEQPSYSCAITASRLYRLQQLLQEAGVSVVP